MTRSVFLVAFSNYHWWHYIHSDGQVSTGSFHVNQHEQLPYYPSCEMTEHNLRLKYLPKSARNHLMYYILNEESYPHLAMATVKQVFRIDKGEEASSHDSQHYSFHDEGEQPAKKHGKHACEIAKLTPEILCNYLELPECTVTNCAHRNRSSYSIFCEQLLTDGDIM